VTRADHALYLAKDHGRDRVCTWTMIRAMEAAEQVSVEPESTLALRTSRWLSVVSVMLGPVQREQIGPHGRAVGELAGRIARGMGIEGEALAEVVAAAELHDIGKVCIPESLLAKPTRLSDAEKRYVDEHARYGADLAGALGAGERVCGMIVWHHRRFDKAPASREASSVVQRGAAIISVADAVVAMLSDRPYASRRTSRQALAEAKHERGRQFDPEVVDIVEFLGHDSLAPCAM
jgi:HD-GYP domain-containing protein (c-di-GMP phosphodiesterase class II)